MSPFKPTWSRASRAGRGEGRVAVTAHTHFSCFCRLLCLGSWCGVRLSLSLSLFPSLCFFSIFSDYIILYLYWSPFSSHPVSGFLPHCLPFLTMLLPWHSFTMPAVSILLALSFLSFSVASLIQCTSRWCCCLAHCVCERDKDSLCMCVCVCVCVYMCMRVYAYVLLHCLKSFYLLNHSYRIL